MHRFATTSLLCLLAIPCLAETPKPIAVEVYRDTPLFLLQVGDLAGDGVIKSMTQAEGPIPKEVSASTQLAIALQSELKAHSMQLGPIPEEVLAQKRGHSLNGDRPNTIQIFTDYSSISYLPFHWGTYQYGIKGRARLIDNDGKVVWEKKCYIKTTKADPRFQIAKEGFDSEGRRVREVVRAASQECARIIAGQI
jgi:hypothetical protein